MSDVKGAVLARDKISLAWPWLKQGIDDYRNRTPHELPDDAGIFSDWTAPGGDEVFAFATDGEFSGFMSFKVQELDGERWGTIAMIYVVPKFQQGDTLPEVATQLEAELRRRGCDVMNYMTKRKGFKRLAPRLGFKPRIIEWAKEL